MVDVAGVVVDFATTQTLLKGDGGVEGETARADEIKKRCRRWVDESSRVSGCFGSDWTIIHPRLFPLLVTAYHLHGTFTLVIVSAPVTFNHMHLPRSDEPAMSHN